MPLRCSIIRAVRNSLTLAALAALLPTAASAQDLLKSQPAIWSAKPDAAAFEKSVNDRLAAAQLAIDSLLAVKGPRTIDNTLAPYDQALERINAASHFATVMQNVHPDAAFRDRATALVTKASDASTSLSLNRDVYQALAGLDLSHADAPTRYYVQRQLLEFQLAGVNKDDPTRAHLKQLNDELTDAQSAFGRNIADDQRSVEISSPADLDGLPADFISNHKPAADGKIRISTNYPDFFPVLKFAQNEDLRRRLMIEFLSRGYPKNSDVLKKMMQARYEIATILGYSSWADYNAADKMIRTGANIASFIQQLETASRPAAQREFAMLLAEKQKSQPGAKEVWEYDASYYSELLRRSQYNFDSQSVRPYFPFAQVKQGILDTAAKFFRVTFRQELDSPSWDPSVETWDVLDNGQPIGRFYLDMHPRANKFEHAAMFEVLDGVRGKQLPEAILVCNLPGPTASDPGLNESDDVVTFFHEFGHLMHWILAGQQQWAGISGLNMESDFIEAPSEMLEDLIRSPQVLALFARDYKTGQPIPADLVARMNRASAFGRAGNTALQNSFTALSYDIYKSNPATIDLDAVADSDTRRYSLFPPAPGTHMWAAFGHLASYSSSYYTYMWDLVIAEDFFAQFDSHNPLAGDTPLRYRRTVLEPGGSMSANDLVKNFLGRPQNMQAFEHWMAEEFQPTPAATTTQTSPTPPKN
jgi:thimet oligopeptidase